MEDNNELNGSYVLIHPDVYFDRENNCGFTGVLTEADRFNDRFYVDLENGKEPKRFASDWLMVMKGATEIYEALTANMQTLSTKDIKDLYGICLLLDSPEAEHQQRALQMASANPNIREHTLITLEDKLALGLRLTAGEDHQMNRGRVR